MYASYVLLKGEFSLVLDGELKEEWFHIMSCWGHCEELDIFVVDWTFWWDIYHRKN